MLIVFLRPIFDFEPRSIVAYDIWVIQDGKNLDLPQETLQALLTHAPHLLFRHRPEWGTPARAAHAERTALRLHARIAALYERAV